MDRLDTPQMPPSTTKFQKTTIIPSDSQLFETYVVEPNDDLINTRTKLLNKRRIDNTNELINKFDKPYITHNPIYDEHDEYKNSPKYTSMSQINDEKRRTARKIVFFNYLLVRIITR